MAELLSLLSLLFVTFLIAGSSLTLARDISTGETSLIKEPDEYYYITRKKPAIITCQAKHAAEILFTCMGTQIPETSVEVEDVSDIDPNLIQAKIEVTRTDVQHYADAAPFWCTCSAVAVDGQLAATSSKGYVVISYLNSTFSIQPKSTTASAGENVEFTCGAPGGQPKPEIMWRRDRKRLEGNPRLIITDLGSLVIRSVTKEDGGLYQCVARNVAGRLESESAQLTVVALEESAEPELALSEADEASKKASGIGKPRATRQSIQTSFTIEPHEKYYVTEDKPVMIDCGVVAADILTFRCNGKRMDRERQTTNQGLDQAGNRNIQSQLRITYADVQAFKAVGDNQTFQCVCAAWFQDSGSPNGWGRLDSNAGYGSVYLAYLDSTFQREPTDVTAVVNTDVTIACKPPKGEPTPWVYWYKDGNRLDLRSSNKFIVNAEGHLIIHNVRSEDAGTYNCVAENSVKSVQSRAGRLTVIADAPMTTTASHVSDDDVPSFPEVIPSMPVFLPLVAPESTFEKDGTKIMICAVIPADQMTVNCGNKRLSTDEYELKSKVHKDTGKRLLYAIVAVNADAVAQSPDGYFCQCTAWFLTAQNSWERVLSDKRYIKLAAKSVYIGDQFAIAPKDTYAYYEAEAELVCKPPEGSPTPAVHWLKDGAPIDYHADPNYVILEEGTLVIEYVRLIDEGQYTCVAENEAGRRSSHPVQLTVLGKPEPTEPVITSPKYEWTTIDDFDSATFRLSQPIFSLEPNSENYIIRDQAVNLSCTVIAAKTLVFVCNGEVLRETTLTALSSTHPEIQQSILENSLVITKEKIETHRGAEAYNCVCRAYYQKAGADPDLAYIESSPAVIQVAYLRNLFLQEPSDTQVPYLGRAELLCMAPNGNPEPQIHWLKDGFKISQNERIHIEGSGNLVIDEFSEEDEGAYTCVAENIVRSRTSQTATVTLSDESVVQPEVKPVLATVQPDSEKIPTVIEWDLPQNSTPYISKDLHAVYSLITNKQVTISCEAYSVEFITFTCGMQKVEDQEVKERMDAQVLPDGRTKLVKVIEASINVSKNEVENYTPEREYWCQCHAHYHVPHTEELQELISTKGVLEIAPKDSSLTNGRENEVSKCAQMLTDCSIHLPHSVQDLQFCVEVPEYIVCTENYIKKCDGVINIESMNAVKMTHMDIHKRCSLQPKCPELESCTRMSSMSPSGELTVQNFCSDGNHLSQCVDQALTVCNATLSPLEEEVKANLFGVVRWFTSFCDKLIYRGESFASCDEMMTCDLYIGQLVADNTTSWCRLMSALVECTNDAVNACGLDEWRNDLEQLHAQASYITCSEDKKNGEAVLEVTPEDETEPTGKSEPAHVGETKVESIAGTDDGYDINNESIEGGAEASKESSNNGSARLFTSLLVTILQFQTMVILLLR